MGLYTQLCVLSSAVSSGTVGFLLWNTSRASDAGYIYFSLAAPTVILGYHLLYFLNPFLQFKTPSYAPVPRPSAFPRLLPSTHGPRGINACDDRPIGLHIQNPACTSEDRNPMVSSTPGLLCLTLLTVLAGAIALSAGTAAILTTIERASLQAAVQNLAELALYYNTTTLALEAGIDAQNATVTPAFAPTAAKMDPKALSMLIGDVAEITRSREAAAGGTIPPAGIIATQAILSLAQMLLLGSIVFVGLQRRASRYASEGADADEEEEEYDLAWSYVEDDGDSVEDAGTSALPTPVMDYVRSFSFSAVVHFYYYLTDIGTRLV